MFLETPEKDLLVLITNLMLFSTILDLSKLKLTTPLKSLKLSLNNLYLKVLLLDLSISNYMMEIPL